VPWTDAPEGDLQAGGCPWTAAEGAAATRQDGASQAQDCAGDHEQAQQGGGARSVMFAGITFEIPEPGSVVITGGHEPDAAPALMSERCRWHVQDLATRPACPQAEVHIFEEDRVE